MCLGIPGQVLEIINPELNLASVSIGGVKRPVNLACILDEVHSLDACVGEWVLVHVGFAISRLDTDEAARTLALLQAMTDSPAAPPAPVDHPRLGLENAPCNT